MLLAASVALLIAFVMIESRVEDPLLPLSIFRLRMVAAANVAGLLLGGSFFAFVFAGTLYMQQVLHYSAPADRSRLACGLGDIDGACRRSRSYSSRVSGQGSVMAIGMTLIGTGIIWATQGSG